MSALSSPAVFATTLTATRPLVRSLYRKWLLAAPTVVGAYQLDVSVPHVRNVIRHKFRENSSLDDARLVSVLVHRGKAELEETLMLWKQPSHLMQYFIEEEQAAQPTDFLGRFYQGTA